ncbi:sodium ABC transporter ATP-binding protein [Staphylococcus warneri]|uniref:ABC transporter ATP-binding protein n=1 Tax=Staphylococcus warneri TaxID=1292 RepID=UPI000D1D4521|nr:ATP-binding cassette domain-containing protein [Staphylococcus warneri]PTI59907.1 sodium ABC transporter ATP-binding protein [Staphylococcus warneri]
MTLKVDNIYKYYGDFLAVDNINFSLEEGKMLGFIGRNGAGKTTTFRMILGVTEPTNGNVTFQNKKIDTHLYNRIGYLPEERGLHTKLKVYDELKYMAKLKGLDKKEIDYKIKYWLDEFKIANNKNKKIENLSKGNQQKIQLLASIIHEPDLLILDEPFSGLDPINVELLKKTIKNLKEKGKTIILSTHRMDHVEELCDEIIIINEGKSVLQGNIKEVKSKYTQKNVVIKSDVDISEFIDKSKVIDYKNNNDYHYFKINNNEDAYILVKTLIENNISVRQLEISEPKMDEIFLTKVGEIYE